MKPAKANGPDDLGADLWKLKSCYPAEWLFFNTMIAEETVPDSWQIITTIPIWKNKGISAECASYRLIRSPSHSIKIFERIVDGRIRDVVQLSANQCAFVPGCGTNDAIPAARLLLERRREKQKPVHLACLDLEKPFNRVLRKVVWQSLKQHNVPEELRVGAVTLLLSEE
ncbi:unnamed protein product [Heligmosomoides polygyrus]|uniref:Reverse transcriptase domain-containing protein n=1 Tax=Heligmosomoides polygyrus TaxID=6339 RepID=A0A183G426_HELPZ|nr:unnamed protein product [Heligmosomoides polygyrus]